MFWHLRMILAYKKTLGKFTKVLGFEKTPLPPPLGKIPKKSRFFFWAASLTALCTNAHCFFLFDISPIHQVQQVLHFGGELSRMLALIIVQLFQVSNWFGNKRIRYKKNIVKAQVRLRLRKKRRSAPL